MNELLRYLTGTLGDAESEALEHRLFEGPRDPDVERLLGLHDALRAMKATGPLVPVVVRAELRALAASTKITEHDPIEGVVRTAIGDEAFVAARIPVSLRGVSTLDVVFCTALGVPYFRVHEAPFDPESGEIIVLCERHVAIATGTLRIQVVDRSERIRADVRIENVPAPRS